MSPPRGTHATHSHCWSSSYNRNKKNQKTTRKETGREDHGRWLDLSNDMPEATRIGLSKTIVHQERKCLTCNCDKRRWNRGTEGQGVDPEASSDNVSSPGLWPIILSLVSTTVLNLIKHSVSLLTCGSSKFVT